MNHSNNRFHREAIQVAAAQKRIEPWLSIAGIEEVGLIESFGRRLADDIAATHPVPHFRRSGMDGYAVRSSDTIGARPDEPTVLEVIETIPCGSVPAKAVVPGTASRIMTGAAMPDGADAVIMLEMTETVEVDGKSVVRLKKQMTSGDNVAAIGSEVAEGETVLERGRKINPGEAALLATFGFSRVRVYKKPVVAIFSTGSELLGVDSPLQSGKIRNSNSYMLAALVQDAGALPMLMECVPDDVAEAKKRILAAFTEADLIITTGGVSVGDYDILVDLFEQWDGRMLFNKVLMRPGSPTTVGVWQNQLLFALSGNPGACFVGFELFVRPVLWAMQGKRQIYHKQFTAVMQVDFNKAGAYPRFVRGCTETGDGILTVKPVGTDKSSIMVSIKDADCLIMIPPGGKGLRRGDKVSVIKLNETD